jgi:hypothetical protein
MKADKLDIKNCPLCKNRLDTTETQDLLFKECQNCKRFKKVNKYFNYYKFMSNGYIVITTFDGTTTISGMLDNKVSVFLKSIKEYSFNSEEELDLYIDKILML